MAQLTDFLLSCKTLDNRNVYINDLGANLLNQALLDALMEYSEANPRGYRNATVEIAVGDEEILLPADCLTLDDDTAHLLYYGYNRPKYIAPGSYPPRNGSNSSRTNSPLDNTNDSPGSTSRHDSAIVPVSTSDLGRISIQLSYLATQARSHTISYQAYHVISNNPDMNTVDHKDRRKVRKLVLGYIADARRRQAIEQERFEAAKELEKAAKEYFAVREEYGGAFGGIY